MRFLRVAAIGASIACLSLRPLAAQEAPRVFLLDGQQLAALREQVRADDATLAPAMAELRRRAEGALTAGPFSVVHKDATPPSGDKHDYMSQAPYWWPNPDTADGLPYVRRDGERNPEINRITDRAQLMAMVDAVETLALAWYFTGDAQYADRAALLVRAWFLDEATRMTPHLRFAQAIPGVNEGRGIGIIETRVLARLVDALGLLAGAAAWPAEDEQSVRAWLAEYFEWLIESEPGRDEADELNNHGTFYDVQAAALALYLGERDEAERILGAAGDGRIKVQIEPDGAQPLELARTNAWSYSTGNLLGLMQLARLAEHVDVDLWAYETADGRSLRKAVDFLAPFGMEERPWAYQQINGFEPTPFYPILRVAAAEYPDGPYKGMLAKIPAAAPIDQLRGR
jgi:hypothetical protein